ncbi:helix-turn-helix domain-containing protein [Flagellimonas sp. CMM7]|uniref:hybrid sensor histidine kinase/response regulator transcription factor n=1 Tax=Flagellimonas sp. CMM7 TaxID=2654676 RepID=UPI0013D18005|nr:helix-turn-helix domain-containing protein [Flagellimonas sp. CMM7]UII78412.1 helix-turn-helix domain-containing protein [Flagellimonas sp. CMM7]
MQISRQNILYQEFFPPTKMIRACLLVLFLVFNTLLEAQSKTNLDSLVTQQGSNNQAQLKEVRIYNYLDTLLDFEEKLNFVLEYQEYATDKELNSDILFSLFLRGEIEYGNGNIEEAILAYQNLVTTSEKLDNAKGLFLGNVGLFYAFQKKETDITIQAKQKEIDNILFNVDNVYFKALFHRRVASYYIKKEKYSEALNLLLEIDVLPELKESNTRGLALSNIGWIYEHLNYPEKAKIYYQRALKVVEKTKSIRQLKFYALKLSHIELFNMNNPALALEGYLKLLPYYSESGSYQEGVLYGTMGFAYLKTEKIDLSRKYLEKSKNIFETRKDSAFLCLPYTYLTHFYYENGEFNNAIKSGEKALKIIDNKNLFKARKLLLLDKLAASHSKDGDFHRAYALMEELNEIKADLELKKNNIAFLENQYELVKSNEQLEIEQLNNEILSKNNIIYLALITIISAFLVSISYRYSNRQKTNKKLRELASAKSNFFANISHELRTPLTLIKGPLEAQLENSVLTATQQQNLLLAKKNTDRLETLVGQILDLSKLESGHYALKVSKGDLPTFLKTISESFLFRAHQKEQQLDAVIIGNDGVYWYDQEVLQKVVVNLLGNALKYSPEKARISFRAKLDSHHLSLTIRNTDTNISTEELKQIFNRFHRTHSKETGTGIGLALTKELVELHRGTIRAESELDSVTFFVELPIDEATFQASEIRVHVQNQEIVNTTESFTGISNEIEPKKNILNGEQPMLLMVDDNADIRTYISSLFDTSFRVITAKNGKTGFKRALENVPDLIITDLMMPEDNGLKLTQNCKTHHATSHIPIIMLTAKTGDENRLTGLETGADVYLTKPFNNKILKQSINNLLESREMLQKRFSKEVILTPKEISISSYDERFLNSLQEVLDKQLPSSDFSTEAFAKALGMSRMQLHRKLKALTGQTTTEFIRDQRLKLAADLLKKSDVNVSEIGYRVGFNNHSHFTKCFKKQFGVSPSDYKAS